MTSNLLVPSDGERPDGVSRFGGDRGLTGELFEYFRGSGQTITGFTDGDVYEERSERSE